MNFDNTNEVEDFLLLHDIKPTSNRILVTRHLAAANGPLSLSELETELDTLDKSSISRVLGLLSAHSAVHEIEDGRGIAKYELCDSTGHCSPSHYHAHFYCEKCHATYCLDDVHAICPSLPDNFSVNSINFMIKGVCANCR